MAATTAALPKTKGGAFLLEERAPRKIFTPEDFTDEHRAIARTTEEFCRTRKSLRIWRRSSTTSPALRPAF